MYDSSLWPALQGYSAPLIADMLRYIACSGTVATPVGPWHAEFVTSKACRDKVQNTHVSRTGRQSSHFVGHNPISAELTGLDSTKPN